MTDFSLKKIDSLGQTLSAKEAVKIIVAYIHKEDETGKDYQNEKQVITKSLASSLTREYNFYVSLYRSLNYLTLDIQTVFLDIKIKAAYLSKIHYVLFIGALAEKAERLLRTSPIIISLPEYQQKLDEEKQKRLQAIMTVDELAKSETYHSLLTKEQITKDEYPEQESLNDAIENIGKTHEELVEDCYKNLGEFERRKIAWDSERKPEDIPDEEVKTYIAEHTNLLDKATLELKKIYEEALSIQTKRLQKLLEDGILQAGKDKDTTGIITESIYKNISLLSDQWIKRYIDDQETYEMGEEDEHGYFHRYVASYDSFYYRGKTEKSFYDIELSFTKDLLGTIQLLKPSSEKLSLDTPKVFDFKDKNQAENIKQLLDEVQELSHQLYTHFEVVQRIEKDFFDGMEVISRKGLLISALAETKEIIADHNKSMQKVLDLYQERYWNSYSIQDFDSLLLPISTDFDEKQVTELYQKFVTNAQEESKYNL